MAKPIVVHRPAAPGSGPSGVFALESGGKQIGYLDYTLPDARSICIEYVEVDRELRGRDLGRQLVDAAVNWARAERRSVTATCGFAFALLHRSPEYSDVRRPGL